MFYIWGIPKKIKKLKKMKRILFFVIMVVITAEAQVNIANGLLAYYPYNGNANDASGNGYNGTVGTGVTLSTDRFGVQNKAYDFQNDAIVSSISYDLDSNYTISAWFNTSASNHIRLFLWAETLSQPIKSTSSEFNRGNSNAYIEAIYTAYDPLTCGLNQNSAFAPSSASPNPYTNSQWHMLTLTRNNNLLSLYIDSVFIDDKIIVDNCTPHNIVHHTKPTPCGIETAAVLLEEA
jgi:hypothetical protein